MEKLNSLLLSWAKHEALGRLSFDPEVPVALRERLNDQALRREIECETVHGKDLAIYLLKQVRASMLASLYRAEPLDVVDVSLDLAQVDRLGWLEHRGLAELPLNDFMTSLAAADAPFVGRLIGVAVDPRSAIQVIDGIHRARAWIERLKRGQTHEPVAVSVVVTRFRTRWQSDKE